jgi:hypothetical protein
MSDKTVVRNAGYPKVQFEVRERHNERENQSYGNGDIERERFALNVQFKSCEGTYEQEYNRLLENGTIVKHGLKAGAKVFDELVFDVTTDYFERNGGYDYAKKFFEEVYRLAVKEVGSEDYILSAIMHADERNSALSKQLGRDVYHYHLHVTYVPVVQTELKYSKDYKDETLRGKVKKVIPQISHSKKWPRRIPKLNDDGTPILTKAGKPTWINSYSLLQDRYFEHMRDTGFVGFERGERGSTAEHLDVVDFKIQQDEKRLDRLSEEKEKQEKQIEKNEKKLTVQNTALATVAEIDAIGKPGILGNFSVPPEDMKKLKHFAKKGVTADDKVRNANRKRKAAERERDELKNELAEEKKKRSSITGHLSWWSKFTAAMIRAPKRLMAVIEDILRKPPEVPEPEQQLAKTKKVETPSL